MAKKILVAYYSWSGRTKEEAQKLARENSGDLLEINVPKNTFSDDMYETFDISKKQVADDDYPEIDVGNIDFNKYDEIMVGSPVWGGMPATPIHTFLQLLKSNNYPGLVSYFYTDAGTVGDFVGVFKDWAKSLEVED
ncbi:flavodoxin [Lactobacillus sp. LL6]|uniref:flavodoxin n=1 Tax=Lactobacillus sp. LL6 TaxID=2596827 RepID=UPI0011868CF7|nr:flavodoxin [Lactobacillus sp. LL6]TSO26388.1 transcriptional regulator [Lactobacillus sp. LL6]